MPLPKPKDDETEGVFIDRCMGDGEMTSEFPEPPQRRAVCQSLWEGREGKSVTPSGKSQQPTPPDGFMVDKDVRRIFSIDKDQAKLKGKADVATGNGWIEGYAAVWDVVDHQHEVIRKGAFAKSIMERVPAGKVKLMVKHLCHGGAAVDVIGTITEAKEDDFGLWFHAEVASTQDAQDMRAKVMEGHINLSSVGYIPVRWDFVEIDDNVVMEHLEDKLLEVTLTPVPANEFAMLTAAKSLGLDPDKISETFGPDLDVGALDAEGKSRVIKEAFGDREKATAFAKSMGDLGSKLSSLLKEQNEPEPTGKTAGLHSMEMLRQIEQRKKEVEVLLLG